MNRTPEQEAARRAKQRATAAQPNCARCNNKAPIDDQLCASCRRVQDEQDYADNQVECCKVALKDILVEAGVNKAPSVALAIRDLIEAMIKEKAL